VHHLPIDLGEFAFERKARDANHVIAVGSLEPMKGYDTLVAAAGQLATGIENLRLTFIGDGSQRTALEASCTKLGVRDRVTFTGWRTPDQVRRALATATVLVHPSAGLGDAVPTVIKEALALGTPVVASDVAGIPELLDGGACGVLVPPSKADVLAAAIAGLLADPGKLDRLALAGRAHAESMFDIRRNGPRLAAILRHTKSGRRGPADATGCAHLSSAAS
jgi:glycosyltransferase involved in cell wall biosynthesis